MMSSGFYDPTVTASMLRRSLPLERTLQIKTIYHHLSLAARRAMEEKVVLLSEMDCLER